MSVNNGVQLETARLNAGGIKKHALQKFYILLILVATLFVGYRIGQTKSFGPVASTDAVVVREKNRENAPHDVDWQLLWDAIDKINEKYVDKPVDMQKILYGAVSGAVGALDDPYSLFLPPQQAGEFQEELRGNFEGIGAEIAIKNQQLVIVTPLEGSPAIDAGIKPGDFIFKIDGQETKGITLEVAVKKIRGRAGTKVTLTVLHKGDTATVEIGITRAKIEVKSLQGEIRTVRGQKIGFIKLRRFGEDTPGVLANVINNFAVNNVHGVVLDLRNNPGGYLDTAVEVASHWVKPGDTVVVQRFYDGREQQLKASGRAQLNRIPTIVLVNGGSASASEIVAGALHDLHLATLVGEKTFGKGSVQELINLRGGGDLKLTIAKWLTPDGHDLNKEGLEPDVKVELKDEDFSADRDPQLDKAYEILVP